MKKLVVLLISMAKATFLLCAASTTLASAHSTLLRADPPPNAHLAESPAAVTLWFDEELDRRFSTVSVLDQNQVRVDLQDVTFAADARQMRISLKRNLPPGAYTIAYRVLSAVDGHLSPGFYSIFVGSASSATAVAQTSVAIDLARLPLDVMVRALNLLAALALCGASTLKLLMNERNKPFAALRRTAASHLRRWVLLNLAVLFFGIMLSQLLQAMTASGQNLGTVIVQGIWLSAFSQTRFGQAALGRLLLVISLFVLYAHHSAKSIPATAQQAGSKRLWKLHTREGLEFALTALILFSFSLSSHAAASSDTLQLALVADWLHLLAIGVWTGGLFALTFVVRPLLGTLPADAQQTIRVVLHRFSNIAIASVVVFTITGLYSMWRQVASPNALVASAYGETLLVKHLFIGPLLLLGALNTLLLRRETIQSTVAMHRLGGWVQKWLARVAQPANTAAVLRNVRLEAAFAVLATLAAATMTALPPGRSSVPPTPPAYLATRAGSEATASLKIEPFAPGHATFSVKVTDPQGNLLPNVTRVNLRFTFLGSPLGTTNVEAKPAGNGLYTVEGNYLSVIGLWRVDTIIRRKDIADDLRVPFRLNMVDPASIRPADLPEVNAGMLVAVILLLIGSALLVLSWRQQQQTGQWLGSGVLAGGVVLFLVSMAFGTSPVQTYPVNPLAPDEVSLVRGKSIYEQHCSICHGPTGKGSELLSEALRPTEFLANINQHTDDVLYNWLTNGIPGTAMVPWKNRLSDSQRWHVLNYIEYLAERDTTAPPANQ